MRISDWSSDVCSSDLASERDRVDLDLRSGNQQIADHGRTRGRTIRKILAIDRIERGKVGLVGEPHRDFHQRAQAKARLVKDGAYVAHRLMNLCADIVRDDRAQIVDAELARDRKSTRLNARH